MYAEVFYSNSLDILMLPNTTARAIVCLLQASSSCDGTFKLWSVKSQVDMAMLCVVDFVVRDFLQITIFCHTKLWNFLTTLGGDFKQNSKPFF